MVQIREVSCARLEEKVRWLIKQKRKLDRDDFTVAEDIDHEEKDVTTNNDSVICGGERLRSDSRIQINGR